MNAEEIGAEVSMEHINWCMSIVEQARAAGIRTTPVFKSGSTLSFANGQSYTERKHYVNAIHVALILDDLVLVDVDNNKVKEGTLPVTDETLCQFLGVDELPEPFQINNEGTSAHYILRGTQEQKREVEENGGRLKQSNDGAIDNLDVKTGNQLVHLKPHKILPSGIKPVDEYPEASQRLIDVLTVKESIGNLSTEQSTALEYNSSLSESLVEVLEPTEDNIKMVIALLMVLDPSMLRDKWRQVCWAVESLGWGEIGRRILDKWSSKSKTNYAGRESIDQLCDGYDPSTPYPVTIRSLRFMANRAKQAQVNKQLAELPQPYEVHISGEAQGELAEGSSIVEAIKLVDLNKVKEAFKGSCGDVEPASLHALIQANTLRWVPELQQALELTPTGWVEISIERERAKFIRETSAELIRIAYENQRAGNTDLAAKQLKTVNRIQKSACIKSAIELSHSDPNIMVSASELNIDPYEIGMLDGILNIISRALRRYETMPMVTKSTNVTYDADAECPLFIQFLERILPNPEVRKFIQKVLGLVLLGKVVEHKFFFLYGSGSNGKSVLLDLINWLMGDYAVVMPPEALMKQYGNSGGATPDLANAIGSRFVSANEPSRGAAFDDGKLKALTSNDPMSARHLFGNPIIFTPTFTLFLAGNYKPNIYDHSGGMHRRMVLIEFGEVIPASEQDPRLLDKLKREGSGILNWMIDGYHLYRKEGLSSPKAISDASAQYMRDEDAVQQFLDDECQQGANLKVEKKKVYAEYRHWCTRNGLKPMSQRSLSSDLKPKGISMGGKGRGLYIGLDLK